MATPLTFSCAVGLDGQGHLEAFACGTDGRLWRLVQGSGGPGGWGAWMSLGIPSVDVTAAGPPVVGTNSDGRLEVFVKGSDNALWHIPQLGAGFSPWSSLGGALGSMPALGNNFDGRIEVFALDAGGRLMHSWQTIANGGWTSTWTSFGGRGTSIPTVALNMGGPLNNCLEVLVVGNDFPFHHMYHLWQLSPGGAWSGWTSLGGSISPEPSVAQNLDGTLEVFAIGTDVFSGSNVTHNWQTAAGTTNWIGFHSLGNPPSGTLSPTAAKNQDGRLEVFGISPDGALWHNWQVTPSGGWSGWFSLGVPGPGTHFQPTVAANADARLEVFTIATDGTLWHNWQVVPSGAWAGWSSLGTP